MPANHGLRMGARINLADTPATIETTAEPGAHYQDFCSYTPTLLLSLR